jgi:hypothetical protein
MEGQPGRLRVDLTLQRSNAEDGRKIISLSLRGQPRSHSADIRNDVLRHSVKIRRRFRFVRFELSGCRSVWWSLLDGVGCLESRGA